MLFRSLSLGSAVVASMALLVALVALRVARNENDTAEKRQMASV